jgi:Asp-tRNA(Asn)/Glu-tRNA(Gln) amidotransferase A subunit family amidase
VTVFIDDARAFFKKTNQRYDLIVFGYLDSHTLLTSMSSIRLDNYVYTLESFREARKLLTTNGTLVLAYSAGRSFLGDRIYATLAREYDAVLTLSATGPAPLGLESTGDPIFVVAGSCLGVPTISLPLLEVEGLPVGLQLLGFLDADASVVATACWVRDTLAVS